MRRLFIFSACILTLGAAVVVGAMFAQTFNRRGSTISAIQPLPSGVNTYAIDAKPPQAGRSPANANQYGNSLPAPLAQAQPGQGYPAHSPPAPPTGYGTAPPAVRSFPQSANTPQSVPSGFDPYNKRTEGNYFGEAPRQTPENGSAIGSLGQPMKVEFRHRMIPDPNNPGQQIEVSYAQMVPVDGPVDRSELLDESTQQIANLLRELRADGETAPNPEKLQTLRKWVAEQFDKRHKSQVARLEEIQADLQRTQEILDRRDGQRDEIIERRVAQLLGEQDPLQWDYQPAIPQLSVANQGYDTPRTTPASAPRGLPEFPRAPVHNAPPDLTAEPSFQNQDREELPSNPPEDEVANDLRTPEFENFASTVDRIWESRRILDATASNSSQPELDKARERLARAEAELEFHSGRLNRAVELKKLDLADAQKQFEKANIQANDAQKLYDEKIISVTERRARQLDAEVAKNAVTRAEIELNELNQRLLFLNSLVEKPSPQVRLPEASPEVGSEATEDTETTPVPDEAPPSPEFQRM